MAVFKNSLPPPVGYRLIEPCARCGRGEARFDVPWPDLPRDRIFSVCGPCMWSRFHDIPKGPSRRALLRKVFGRRPLGSAN